MDPDQFEHVGVKKNLHTPPPTPGIEPGPSSLKSSALPLELHGPRLVSYSSHMLELELWITDWEICCSYTEDYGIPITWNTKK